MQRGATAVLAVPSPVATTLWVRRSNVTPALYWWSLPLPLAACADLYATELAGCRALVRPARALGTRAAALGMRDLAPGVGSVHDVPGLLRAVDMGGVGCAIAIFPASRSEKDLERAAQDMRHGLERQGFTMAVVAKGDGGLAHRFAFRVPGKVLLAVEELALERRFGGNLGQVEMAFLQGLGLRPGQRARLTLMLADDNAWLQGMEAGGHRRVRYLESQNGYVGRSEELGLRAAVGERMRDSWHRFPAGALALATLPVFIGAFWARNTRARRHDAAQHSGR
ncbi:MAG TPA: hypothetical protein VFD07_12730 [Candidatus Krumholzibacteria bacterium]|nr:hypothetical protein [Candidatus Krumholzibacteria bacterium]